MTLTATQARQLASIFSRPVFRALGANSLPSSVQLQLRDVAASLSFSAGQIGTLFESAFKELQRSYRSEYVYKNLIARKLIFGVHSPASAALLSEFWVGMSKADAVILNGTSTVYEIKTEFDNLSRLPQQLLDYGKVFDHINVVTHERAVRNVMAMVPEHVGVLTLTPRNTLKRIKDSRSNADNIDHWTVFNCLRKEEFLNILVRQFGRVPQTSADMLRTLALKEFEKIPKRVVVDEFVSEVKRRTTSTELVEFTSALPTSLKTLGLSEPLSALRRGKLLEFLERPCESVLHA